MMWAWVCGACPCDAPPPPHSSHPPCRRRRHRWGRRRYARPASSLVQRFERRAHLSHAEVQLVKFGTAILVVAHWMSCAWCMMLTLERPGAYTWYTALVDADGDGQVSRSPEP